MTDASLSLREIIESALGNVREAMACRKWKERQCACLEAGETALAQLADVLARLPLEGETIIPCRICGKPATCIGEYETCTDIEEPACDACCGHGCEDGNCRPIAEWVIATLKEQAASQPAETRWQPTETAPKDGRDVLLYAVSEHGEVNDGVCIGHRLDREDWELVGGGLFEPTHWMPLPLPPSEKGAE